MAGRLPAALLPGGLAVVLGLLVWTAQTVSFALVLSGRRMRIGVLAAALAASAATAATAFYDEIEPLPPLTFFYALWVPVLGWQVLVLAGQRRDGRWSRATLRAGLVAACLTLVSPYPGAGLVWVIGQAPGLPDEGLGVFIVVWLARSAHELAGPGALPEELGPPRRLPRPILPAGVLLPFLVLVAPPPPARYAWQPEPPRTGSGQAVDTEDYVAEANARCRDPWPRVRAGGDAGAGRPLPNLAVRGLGRYRLRVYARAHEEIGEQHLVVVFPGRSAGKVVYR